MVRLTLMYYIDFVAFMENPDKTWNNILTKEEQKAPPEPSLLIRGAYFWKKEVRSLILMGFGQGYYARLSFTGQQYKYM